MSTTDKPCEIAEIAGTWHMSDPSPLPPVAIHPPQTREESQCWLSIRCVSYESERTLCATGRPRRLTVMSSGGGAVFVLLNLPCTEPLCSSAVDCVTITWPVPPVGEEPARLSCVTSSSRQSRYSHISRR